MKTGALRFVPILLTCSIGCGQGERRAPPAAVSPCEGVNVLTDAEKSAGWRRLFDGKSKDGWHGYNGQNIESWTVEDCALKSRGAANHGGVTSVTSADLATDAEYKDFEISIDWKASKGGNSGVIYGVREDAKYEASWQTGPEYQLIDDVSFPEKLEDWQKAGANYAMHVPSEPKELKPVGEWNVTKIVVQGPHVEHWLNGRKILEFERWNDDWKRRRDSGKWKDAPDYGAAETGRIVLQDHGSVFWFRNIKLRPIG